MQMNEEIFSHFSTLRNIYSQTSLGSKLQEVQEGLVTLLQSRKDDNDQNFILRNMKSTFVENEIMQIYGIIFTHSLTMRHISKPNIAKLVIPICCQREVTMTTGNMQSGDVHLVADTLSFIGYKCDENCTVHCITLCSVICNA